MENAIVGARCCICHRALRDPVSVKRGIGPVCWARDKLQGKFDFMRARTELCVRERPLQTFY